MAAILLVAGVGVLVARGALAPGTERTTTAAKDAVAAMLAKCGVDEPCLTRETTVIVSSFGSEAATAATLATYREKPATRPPCHTYMHILGGSLTPEVERGNVPDVGAAWTECGAGLIHGAFENIPISGNDSGRLATTLELCESDVFSSSQDRYHACIHAIGHGVHTGVGGDLGRGEKICTDAVTKPEFATNNPCLAGVYMADRDTRLAGTVAPRDTSAWSNLLGHCAGSPQPATCAMAYAEIFTRGDRASATSYLDWCLEAGVESDDCLRLLGQGGAVAQIQAPSSELTGGLCPRAAAERGLDPAGCYDGMRNVFRFLNRTPEDAIESAMCELLRASGDPCPQPGN